MIYILTLPFIEEKRKTKNSILKLLNMEKEQPKKSKGNFYVGLVVGIILYGIIKEFIWPLISN